MELFADHGRRYTEAVGEIWEVLIDKTEEVANDRIKMITQGEGIKAYRVVYRWFTSVSGLGLAEQARRLMHPNPPKREEDLAEHVEMWQDMERGDRWIDLMAKHVEKMSEDLL